MKEIIFCYENMEEIPHKNYVKELIRCENCIYFLADEWGIVDKLPAIVGHNVCTNWNKETTPGGYCHKAEFNFKIENK